MTRLSVELVPRSEESLLTEAASLPEIAPWADTINVPDLVKFDLRSWRACPMLRGAVRHPGGAPYSAIPHIRACDVNPDEPLPMVDALRAGDVTEVLVVSGDDADYFAQHTYAVDSVDVIRRFREEMPEVTVYAGLDPYRQGMSAELRLLERKLVAGASGVFTQPFFDVDHLRSWRRVVSPELSIWWGATTVTTLSALGYWRRRNLVAFPQDFSMEIEAQREFAQRLIDLACEWEDNVYLMPVRTSPAEYLQGLRVGADVAGPVRA
ncbi:methylenetetrahydrofolate reductase [Kytococcus sedentarius]|uniref:methylenetetrahydrofolate reductase n=1 Tax=Kytococcus sedentarius TaxID=1276 RepID=UPI0035BBB76E